MTKSGKFLAGVLAILVFSANSFADIAQNLTQVNAFPHLKLIEQFGLSLSYTNVNNTTHTGELKVTGVETLMNGGLFPASPTVSIPNVTFALDAIINFSTLGAYSVTSGTLTLTNGGSDINATIAPSPNFGFDFISPGGGAFLYFNFVQQGPSALLASGVPIVNGTGLGVDIDVTDANYLPTLASFTTNGGLNYLGTLAKSDIIVATPLPKAAYGLMTLLVVVLAGTFMGRRRAKLS